MIVRAPDAGTPARWVAGDKVYGADLRLRAELHRRQVGYVLAVASTRWVLKPPAHSASSDRRSAAGPRLAAKQRRAGQQ